MSLERYYLKKWDEASLECCRLHKELALLRKQNAAADICSRSATADAAEYSVRNFGVAVHDDFGAA